MMNPANPLNLPAELPIARYRFSFRLNENLCLPPYAGSTLRGVFGHALRKAACMTRQKECGGCSLLQTCPYSRIFATPSSSLLNKSQHKNPPQPYIIEAFSDGIRYHPADSLYQFDIVLIGSVRQQLPLIAYAFGQAFKRGITKNNTTGTLEDIAVENNGCWQSVYHNNQIQPHTDDIILPASYPADIEITFQTPLRLQQQNSVLGINRLTAEILLKQLVRRTSTLATLYWQSLEADYPSLMQAAAHIKSSHQLQWLDWSRYSNRQQQQINLGGAIGTWQFQDLPLPFSQLLHIGQWLHIGKETVFGYGRYKIKEVNPCLTL